MKTLKINKEGGENFEVVLSVSENDANSHEVCCCIHIFKKQVFVASFLLLSDRRKSCGRKKEKLLSYSQ